MCQITTPQAAHHAYGKPKVSSKILWPFPIVDVMEKAAYKLQLLPDAMIHDVFHVSLLRLAYAWLSASPTLPSNIQLQRIPYVVLYHKLVRRGGVSV